MWEGSGGVITKGVRNILLVIDIFIILVVVIISEVYIYPVEHFKYVEPIVCQSYLNNAGKKPKLYTIVGKSYHI